MTHDYETAVAMLRKAFADGNKLAPLALLYVTALTHRSDDGPEAEAIVKLTPAIPDTPPVATIEKATADLPIPAPLISANTSSLTPAIAQGRVSDAGTPAVIGLSAETSAAVSIGEEERCGGLYVLGQSQTGKSTLLVSLALSDISKGHGILFIDPHTDAIKDLLARIPDHRRNDILLLDPTNKTHSFGLNILHCKDPRNPLAIDETWGRVRDIFVKVWETEKGQLGFWLDKILRNSVYLLLGNPGYTMVEMPLLLREDTTFRNHLLESMKVKPSVRDFWYDEFDRLTRRDRTEQVGPALNRLSVFRDIDIVRHIVGQEVPPIDFQKIIQERKIVLLRLPVNMPSDVKHLIGTMLLSEVLYAAFEREKLAKTDRPYFGIYCDEFQEFATPDFARLFTQTGKYKVMPVVAHQTRLGQFKPGDPNQGATLASPNKVLFTLSASDAKEMAVEFAEKPPTELKDEDVYIISQHPVYDLLHGHDNPEIRALVDKYLRPLMDRLGDLLGEREIERLIRTDYLDEASLYRIEERIEAIRHEDPLVLRSSLGAAGGKLLQARYQTGKQIELMNEEIRIRSTMRMLNRIFIDMMEGKLDRGQEEFSNRLIEIAKAAILPDQDRRILELYIAYAYGEPGRDRILPFELAKRQGLLKEHVEQTERQINTEYETQRLAFRRRIGEINIEEILQENVRMFSTDRINYGRPEWTASDTEGERRRLKRMCRDAIDEYERGEMPCKRDSMYGDHTFFWLVRKITRDLKPLIRRKPADIVLKDIRVIRIFPDWYEISINKDLTTRGYSDIVDSIDGLAELCERLAKPENHVEVKTRQRRQREVPTRTVADMVNEMTGRLTALPRYEAFAKVFEEKAGASVVWKGKIRTGKLRNAPVGALEGNCSRGWLSGLHECRFFSP